MFLPVTLSVEYAKLSFPVAMFNGTQCVYAGAMFRYGIVFGWLAGLICVSGEDSGAPHQQYLRAFENLPTLFNHIIGMLQDKPEVLEKNDVTTFLEAALDDDVNISPRENALNVFKRESNFEDGNDVHTETVQEYEWSLLKADGEPEAFVGSVPGAFQLTADEVAERMLIAEKKLEEYHNDAN